MNREKSFEAYFDGSCIGNPGGPMGGGVYITAGEKVYYFIIYQAAGPDNTSNKAEYMAFIRVLDFFKDKKGCIIQIYGDSDLVVKQMNGIYRIRGGKSYQLALAALEAFKEIRRSNEVKLKWIPRDLNIVADGLSREATKVKKEPGPNNRNESQSENHKITKIVTTYSI